MYLIGRSNSCSFLFDYWQPDLEDYRHKVGLQHCLSQRLQSQDTVQDDASPLGPVQKTGAGEKSQSCKIDAL